jgi:ADP-sugar diphosphatase
VLHPDDNPSDQEKFVITTVQPRIATGSLSFVEIPAGMLDDGTFAGSAAKEIEEECGLKVPESELVNLTALALAEKAPENDNPESVVQLGEGIYPSPGACDEYIPIFLYEQKVSRKELESWQGKLTGLRDEGENITLKIVKLKDLWKEGVRDGKTLAAVALYNGLKGSGKI